MVIQCSHCQARFKLADDKIKPGGTKVRCAKCREIFTVNPGATEAETPPPTTPDTTNSLQTSPTDEFSFDIGDIAASTPSQPTPPLSQETNTFPNLEIALDSPGVGISPYSNNVASVDGAAFSFDSAEAEGEGFSFNEAPVAAISIGISTTSSTTTDFDDDSAFSFDEAPAGSLPIQSDSAPQALASDAFGFGDTSEVDTISFDAAPLAPRTETFSFDSDQEATGFGEFSFDEKPPEDITPSDKFSFEQSGSNSDFSWDEAPATASLESSSDKTAIQQPQGASEDFDFGSISFGDESSAPPIAAPAVTAPASVPQRNHSAADIGTTATTVPAIENAPRAQDSSLPKRNVSNKTTRPRPKPESTISFSMILKFFLIVLIIAGGFFGYLYRDKVQTSYRDLISRLIEIQAPKEDQGEIILKALSGASVLNKKEGALYVIRGEAVNGYKGLRSSILVKAVLYGKQGEILQEQAAYCGNVLNDEILSKASIAELKNTMANELGDSLTNLNIAAGKSVPYTIVFKADPESIKEFAIEVIDSKPGSK